MTRDLKSMSDELVEWLHSDAEEHDVAISTLMEALIRAAYKKVGVGEALRIGMETMPFRPRRFVRDAIGWKVVRTAPYRGGMAPEQFRFGHYRLTRKGKRQPGGPKSRAIEVREPHGREDQELDGWYLTGPGLGSTYVWLGTNMAEAQRESVVWIPRGKR